MNFLLTLLFIFTSFLWRWPSHPLFAATGTITVSAFVPERTATSSFAYTAGGTFNFTNTNNTQVNFTIPANFYTENLQLQVFAYDKTTFESAKPPPSGKSFVGKVYDFNLLTASGGSVSTLSSAPTIVLHYLDSDVSGLDESTIKPYRRGGGDSSWQLINGATVDTTNHKVTFSTANFSSFALFGSSPTPTPTPTPATSSGGYGGGGGWIARPTAGSGINPTHTPTPTDVSAHPPFLEPINKTVASFKNIFKKTSQFKQPSSTITPKTIVVKPEIVRHPTFFSRILYELSSIGMQISRGIFRVTNWLKRI